MKLSFDQLIDDQKGLVSKSVYSDPEIYDLEQEKIFSKCWLFLGLESQIPNPGDYITTYAGSDPVIVTRYKDNKIYALLNSCRHRGMMICRGDFGIASFFRCPYHGWTYKNNGDLVGVPRYKTAYFNLLEKKDWGLVKMPKVVSYKGTIWGTWNENAESFRDYLGEMGTYLDLMLDRLGDELEIYGGIQKWLIPTNWKFASDNFIGDSYHTSMAHVSAVELGLRPPYTDNDFEIGTRQGHGFGAQVGGTAKSVVVSEKYREYMEKRLNVLVQKFGPAVRDISPQGHLGIFPNFSVLDLWHYTFFRVWHPKSPNLTEVHGGLLIESKLPETEKQKILKRYLYEFGPAGIFEQDDAEIWAFCTESSKGYISGKLKLNYQIGLNLEKPVKAVLGGNFQGFYGTPFSEINQRFFYSKWRQLMESD